ncbi:hypothetical protein EAF04_004355 [Stromatinia cepivora]|nr:hypothetical protein EAF04_004355 [Stromatinia cepivora]
MENISEYIVVEKVSELSAYIYNTKYFNNIIRKIFQKYIPNWIYKILRIRLNWSIALQTFEGYSVSVSSIAFSLDDTKVASGFYNQTIRLWDMTTGESLQMLEDYSGSIYSITFSPDDTKVASGSNNQIIRF